MTRLELDGAVALVTGAAGGIGGIFLIPFFFALALRISKISSCF